MIMMNGDGLERMFALEAHRLIDEVIENARSRLYLNADSNIEEEGSPPNIEWFTGEDFSVPLGKTKIEEFIKTWKRDSSWLFCIDFIGEEDYPFDVRYRYRVKWSIPTRRKPIPRATASVYFTIVVSKVKPKTFPVDVYYLFESNRLVHRPGQSRFRQKWLKDIIESKVVLMKDIRF